MTGAATLRSLERARRDGGDRIYGWTVPRLGGPQLYALHVIDGDGRTYFHRDLHQDLYFEAVRFWIELRGGR